MNHNYYYLGALALFALMVATYWLVTDATQGLALLAGANPKTTATLIGASILGWLYHKQPLHTTRLVYMLIAVFATNAAIAKLISLPSYFWHTNIVPLQLFAGSAIAMVVGVWCAGKEPKIITNWVTLVSVLLAGTCLLGVMIWMQKNFNQ